MCLLVKSVQVLSSYADGEWRKGGGAALFDRSGAFIFAATAGAAAVLDSESLLVLHVVQVPISFSLSPSPSAAMAVLHYILLLLLRAAQKLTQ